MESYAPASENASATAVDRVKAPSEDAGVAYLGAVMVPDDELAFHVFAASDAGSVMEACRRAGLPVERLVRSLVIGFGSGQPTTREALPVAAETERPVAHAPGEIGP